MMSEPELKELGDDIRKNGLEQPIVFYFEKSRPNALKDGRLAIDLGAEAAEKKDRGELQLLDGRNRLEAMQLVGLLDDDRLGAELRRAKVIWADEYTPEEYVTTANIHRRHLTGEQKREVVAALLTANPQRSDRSTAKIAQVSPTTVGTVRATLEQAGDVSRLDTRTDSLGRAQPATKPAPVTAERVLPVPGEGPQRTGLTTAVAPREPAGLGLPSHLKKPVAEARADTLMQLSSLLRIDTGKTIEEIVRLLRDARPDIEALPKEKRIAVARGFQRALGLTDADLRPVG
jgi:hypothetical protein